MNNNDVKNLAMEWCTEDNPIGVAENNIRGCLAIIEIQKK